MKFKTYLETIDGVSIYPVITLVMFFTFFGLLTFLVMRTNKQRLSQINNLPLEDTEIPTPPTTTPQS